MKENNGSVLVRILCGDKTILVRQPQKRPPIMWKWPGGKIEDGETVIEAAIRELLEETGINLTGQPFSELKEFPQPHGPNGPYTQHFLTVSVSPELIAGHVGKLVEMIDNEGQKIESTCFTVDELEREPEFMPKHLRMYREVMQAA